MMRPGVPGLVTLLAAAPLMAVAGDVPDLFESKGLELQAELPRQVILPSDDDPPAEDIADELTNVDLEFEPGATSRPMLSEPARHLTAAEEKAVQEFASKAAGYRRENYQKAMEQTIGEVAEKLKIDDAGKEKLNALAPKAIDAVMVVWEEKCRAYVTPYVLRAGGGLAMLKNWKPEQFGAGNQIFGEPAPHETDEWRKGLKVALTPEQFTAFEEAEKAKEAKLKAELADYISASESQAAEAIGQSMDGVLSRILQYGEIDEERQKKLKQASESAVKAATAEWRKRAEKRLLEMPQSQRDQLSQRGGFMGVDMTESGNKPQEQKVWQDAVAQVLTEAERKLVEDRREEARLRRADALSMLLVADLDRLIGFSEEQRERFLKLTKKPLLELPDYYFTAPEGNSYYSIDSSQMLRQLAAVKDSKFMAFLDEGQMKRWKAVTPEQLMRNNPNRDRFEIGELPPADQMDEIEVERILSGFLHREARKMKKKMQSVMESQVANISRVSSPAPEAVAVLNTAAKGAAEELALNSINNLATWVRSQFQSVKPADVPARLQNLSNPYFSERQSQPDPAIWKATVDRILTPAQLEAWKKECAAREGWRQRALSAMVITEAEKRIILKPEQREALAKKLETVISDYEPDFNNFFSFGWHLQGYYTMIPLAMLSDKEMEEIFDKKQIETVKEKCLSHATQYADMIRQQHKSRTRK